MNFFLGGLIIGFIVSAVATKAGFPFYVSGLMAVGMAIGILCLIRGATR